MSRGVFVCLGLTGCFYAEQINQRPALDILQTSTDVVYRGSEVILDAESHDPEGHFVYFHWRAYLCTDENVCDRVPFAELSDERFEFEVPNVRNDDTSLPVQAVRVMLQGQDDYGAVARPEQQLWIPVANRPPTVKLSTRSAFDFVVNTPLAVYAKVSDRDGVRGPQNVTLAWQVFSPTSQPQHTIMDIEVDPNTTTETDPMDPTKQIVYMHYGKMLVPAGEGTAADPWRVQVTATDEQGEVFTDTIPIIVGPDTPPCLRQLSPIAAPTGTAWPMAEPTLFQVNVVEDDLDPYPTINDPYHDPTTFTWSLKPPGATTRQVLSGVTGNSFALDPATYQPGDVLELRVEIADRNATPIPCADANLTCSVTADTTCLQRQTWRVEVR